jgi:hypothetical protein
VLGVNAVFHEPAAIVVDGRIVGAAPAAGRAVALERAS